MASKYQLRAYPRDFAFSVRSCWETGIVRERASLPDPMVLEHFISVCYQASLLREEERPVRFRLIFLAPDRLPPDQGPPTGLHRLLFRDKLLFTERELRKPSPSVDFYGSLMGLWQDEKSGLSIRGIVHFGQRWAQILYGGGKEFQPLTDSLIINATNPGRITVCNGSTDIATLNAGKIIRPSIAVFDSTRMRSEIGLLVGEELALLRKGSNE